MPAGLSIQARDDRMRMMVQALLADRFKMAMHKETKEMPVYALIVGKGGLRNKPRTSLALNSQSESSPASPIRQQPLNPSISQIRDISSLVIRFPVDWTIM